MLIIEFILAVLLIGAFIAVVVGGSVRAIGNARRQTLAAHAPPGLLRGDETPGEIRHAVVEHELVRDAAIIFTEQFHDLNIKPFLPEDMRADVETWLERWKRT